MIVDVHAHGLSEDFIVAAAKGGGRNWRVEVAGRRHYVAADYGPLDPLLYDLDERLKTLRTRGVLQLICPPPPLVATRTYLADAAWTKLLNQSTARLVADGAGMLAGLAVPALADPARAADELREAIDRHGFVGVMLPSSAGDRPLDDPAFAPLFAAIERMGLLAFMHPTDSYVSDGLSDFTLRIIVGWPTETTIAVARLIFAGVLERHPALKLLLAHGGGTLAFLLGRLDLAYAAPRYEANPACRNISRPPSDYLKRLCFDTAVLNAKTLRFLIEQMGSDRVLFGSDFPYEIGDADGALALSALDVATPAVRDAVLVGNARRLLAGAIPGL
jgi:aminocarboxymuconate-semialdehyde decarboxylase